MEISRWTILIVLLSALVAGFAISSVLHVRTMAKISAVEVRLVEAPSAAAAPTPVSVSHPGVLEGQAAPAAKPSGFAPGWFVEVYSARPIDELLASDVRASRAGMFKHSADWLGLNDHQRYQDVFADDRASFVMHGLFDPGKSGKFVFAVHLRMVRDARSISSVVRCSSTAMLQDTAAVVEGEMVMRAGEDKTTLLGTSQVAMTGGQWYAVAVAVSCDLPENVRPGDVMVRLCVRGDNDVKFRPVTAHVPAV